MKSSSELTKLSSVHVRRKLDCGPRKSKVNVFVEFSEKGSGMLPIESIERFVFTVEDLLQYKRKLDCTND